MNMQGMLPYAGFARDGVEERFLPLPRAAGAISGPKDQRTYAGNQRAEGANPREARASNYGNYGNYGNFGNPRPSYTLFNPAVAGGVGCHL